VADDGERENFHRSARARPPPADAPDPLPATTTTHVTSSIQDFAVSLGSALANSELPRPLRMIVAGFTGSGSGRRSRS
jgi:hypothetical protein